MGISTVLVVFALIATIAAFGMGINAMVRGGEYDQTHATQFMSWRVGLQGLTIVLLLATIAFNYLNPS